jgi:hypothetical protein
MKKILSPKEKEEQMFKNGMNSYEHEQVVKECWEAIRKSKENKKLKRKQEELKKKFSTLNFLKDKQC